MLNSLRNGPDELGRFGIYGGRFVAETLMPLILELEEAYEEAKRDAAFKAELDGWFKDYVGRPSPLYLAERLTEQLGGAKVYFKRDELNHTGCPQDQQRARPDDAGAADGQDGESSPRPAPGSTASRQRRWPHGSGWNASSIWASATSSGSSRTCSACGCSAPRCGPWARARAR